MIINTNELIAIGEKYFLVNVDEYRVLEVTKLPSRSSPEEK